MTAETQNEILSANYRASMQRREDAITWADVDDILRDAEEKIALLLKSTEGSSQMDEMFMAIEEARGIAGAEKLKNE